MKTASKPENTSKMRSTGWMLHTKIHQVLLAGGLAFVMSGQAVSQEVNIVVPNDWASRNGNSSTGDFVSSLRWQILIPASQFDSLPAGHNLITQIAYRPDESIAGQSVTSTIRNHEIRLSTTSADNLSRTFADNVGTDVTVVESSDWTFSTSDGPVGEVQPFDFVVDLQTPFFYDPSQGNNLLYEEAFPQGMSAPAPVDQVSGPVFQIVGNSGVDVNGPTTYGPSQVDVPILQFTFVPVPEPSALLLTVIGLALAWWQLRRS